MSANDTQVGGNHYKTDYEHWDLVIKVGLGYFEGCATKYVVRWRKKGGLQDLKKALHFLNKLQESGLPSQRALQSFGDIAAEVSRFNRINAVESVEGAFVGQLCVWETSADLDVARELLLQLFDDAERQLPEAKPVPLTEENHHAERSNQ